ncbi:acetyltransferase [Thermobrachium celere]|nr:acetyltransferase [Thermobrachium celere]
MYYIIRPIRLEDAEDVNEMRRMDGVRETILGIKSERINKTEDFIKNLGPNDYVFVAEVKNNGVRKVVGVVGLHVNSNPRCRHSASIGIMVHKDYQGMGIGKALLKEVLDLADNWLKLVRVELCVFVDNDRAINLYKSLGFQIEGTKNMLL